MRILSIIIFLLLGCTVKPMNSWQDIWVSEVSQTYTWYKSDREPLPMIVHYGVDYEVVQKYCPQTRMVIACAVFREKSCDVYTPFETLNQPLLYHEKKHCDGWEHKEP